MAGHRVGAQLTEVTSGGVIATNGANIADVLALAASLDASSTTTITNAAALTAIDVTNISFALHKVNTYKDFFYLDSFTTRTALADQIIASNVGTKWWVRLNIPDPFWGLQTTWYWDSISGNNENDGSVGNPVKTYAEIDRRTANLPLNGVTIVNVLTTSAERPIINRVPGGTGNLWFTCAPTILASGTVNAVVAENIATNTAATITVNAFAVNDWTNLGLVNHLIRFFNGVTPVATTYVLKDLGARTAQIGYLGNDADVAGTFISRAVLGTVTVGNTFQVVSHPVAIVAPIINNAVGVVYHGLQVSNIPLGNTGAFTAQLCEFTSAIPMSVTTALTTFSYCYLGSVGVSLGKSSHGTILRCHSRCTITDSSDWGIDDVRIFGSSMAWVSGCVQATSSGSGPTQVLGCNVGVWDSIAPMSANGNVFVGLGSFWGTGNGGGGFASLEIFGNGTTIVFYKTPVIVSAFGDINAEGNVIIRSWSDLPIIVTLTQTNLVYFGRI